MKESLVRLLGEARARVPLRHTDDCASHELVRHTFIGPLEPDFCDCGAPERAVAELDALLARAIEETISKLEADGCGCDLLYGVRCSNHGVGLATFQAVVDREGETKP